MSPLQIGMLFHSELAGDVTLYHDLLGLTVDGRFDEPAFRRALADLTAGYEVLRTSFALAGFSVPMQLVHARAAIGVEVISGTDEAVGQWRAQEMERSYDWAAPPLARCLVVVHPGGRFTVGLAVHHAILDGWSTARLVTELLTAYAAHAAGRRLSQRKPARCATATTPRSNCATRPTRRPRGSGAASYAVPCPPACRQQASLVRTGW